MLTEPAGANRIFAYFFPVLKLFFNSNLIFFSSNRKHKHTTTQWSSATNYGRRTLSSMVSSFNFQSPSAIILWWTSCRPYLTNELMLPWWLTCLNQTDFLIIIAQFFLYLSFHFEYWTLIVLQIGKLTLAHLHRQLMVAPTSVCFCYQHFYDPTMGWHANCTLHPFTFTFNSRFNQSTVMNKTCTIKYRSTMTNKLVRLPDSTLVELFFNINWYRSWNIILILGFIELLAQFSRQLSVLY